MKKAHPELARYKNNWPSERMVQTYLCNSRKHKRELGLLGKRQRYNRGGRNAELPIPDNDKDMGNGNGPSEEGSGGSGGESEGE
jgi:hypothetical protein